MNDTVMVTDRPTAGEASLPAGGQTLLPGASGQSPVGPIADLPAALAQIKQLEQALISNRAVSMAIRILMERHHVKADIALAELRRISQSSNVRLAVVATMLLEDHT